jgi:hydroxyacylglutathione hydrolase
MIEIYKTKKDSLHIITVPVGEFSSNCTVIFSDKSKKAIVIDPGFSITPVKQVIEKNNLVVTHILHTHGHFDHITSSSELKILTKAPLYLHKGDEFFYTDLKNQASMFGYSLKVELSPIDHYLQDNQMIEMDVNGPRLTVIHTPGHSQGCCCFFTDDFGYPMIIAGDTLFKQSVGRTDLPGGDFDQIVASIKNRLFIYPDQTIVITGHGPTTTIGDEKKYNPYLS